MGISAAVLPHVAAAECRNSVRSESAELAELYRTVRGATQHLCEPLEVEDHVIQSMPDASPVNWHLAHTTWFFETFVLGPHVRNYRPFHAQFGFLFNSYYNAVGARWPRPQRGLLTRPTVAEVYRYRAYVDEQMAHFLESGGEGLLPEVLERVRLGLNHEQQHQELILTDLKHLWATNPLHPVYREALPEPNRSLPRQWLAFPEGIAWIGDDGRGFAFDNETPRHRVFLHAFELASTLATNSEYRAFLDAGGYERPEFWLSDGWAARQAREWTAPLYWEEKGGDWYVVSLAGRQPLNPAEPVCHVSYYEADAFARWSGARLPTEAEWETAAAGQPVAGHFLEGSRFHPAAAAAADDGGPVHQLYGDVWQWTSSAYAAYPGYRPLAGALGEYNGKFMCNQFVLRGASCVTPRSHARLTYRNFFAPETRWQFMGIRLARDFP